MQELLSATERRGGELSSADCKDQSISELKSELDEQQRKTTELQGLLDDESRKLADDKVTSLTIYYISLKLNILIG